MKTSQLILIPLFAIAFIVGATKGSAELKVYDDFSTGYIDGAKWRQREYVREVVGGEFIFKLGNRSPGMGAELLPGYFRNNLSLVNPETIHSIEADVTIEEVQLDSAIDAKSFIRIGGYFYNKNVAGGSSGDIFAQIMIGDQGNGMVEAFWEVQEMLSDDNQTWSDIGSGTISDFNTSEIDPPYTVKIAYDGEKTFTFTVNGTYSDTFASGPDKRRDPVTSWKGISAGIDAVDGSNNGYVYGKVDNVFINNESTVYDDFFPAMIDSSKWTSGEWVREASNGYLRANSLGIGSTDSTVTHLAYFNAPYLEAKIRIDSTSLLSPGAVGVGRLQGYYYNDSLGPGSGQAHNQYEGDVFAQVRLRYDSNGTLNANAYVDRSDDANESSFTNLFSYNFATPIHLDTFYTLSIQFEGSQLIFGCNSETETFDISTAIYPAYGVHRHLRSRIYLDPGEAGYLKTSYDDVKVETCLGDLQPLDGDVDGSDLVAYIVDDGGVTLRELANDFGKIKCQ